MATAAPKRSRWRRTLRRSTLSAAICVALFLLATTPPVIEFAWRQARNTKYEGPVVRWYLAIYGGRVQRALAVGRIREGQTVKDAVAKYGPFGTTTYDRYTVLEEPGEHFFSFEGYRIVARDGKLVGAAWWTCTGSVVFFDALSPEEWADCNDTIQERRRQQYLQKLLPRMAITGVIGYVQPEPPPADPRDE